MKARPEVLQPIVTHVRPIEEIRGAFEQLEAYAEVVGKIGLRLN